MKLIKLFTLTGLAVVFIAALVGPSSAMAESTALCKADESPCASANQVKHVHYVAKGILVETSIMNYECDALLLADALGLGAPQVLHGSLVYSSCNQGCTRTEISAGGLFKVLRTGNETAEVVGEGTEILVQCGGGLHCVYDLEGITGQIEGPLLAGGNGKLTFARTALHKVSGLLCPKEAYLTALFTPLEALYVKS